MTTTHMKAIVQTDPQDRRSLELREVEVPKLRSGEVLVKVQAAGVNRGDILQTMGAYPPPPGASEILGGWWLRRIRRGSAGPAASRARGVQR